MIELSQIPISSKLKELRGQINTMVNEINTDQMVIGQVLAPSAKIYNANNAIVDTVSASQWLTNQLFAVCMPESNGLYVAQLFGTLLAYTAATEPVASVTITIPVVKLPSRKAEVGTFVTPEHLGFKGEYTGMTRNTGLQFGIFGTGTAGNISAITDTTLDSRSTATLLNMQQLRPRTTGPLALDLTHQNYITQG